MSDPMDATPDDDRLSLDDPQLALVLEYVDGELQADPTRRAAAEALLAASATARAIAEDWTAAKVTLRERLFDKPLWFQDRPGQPAADLSHVRGRVMSKLPAEPRPAVVDAHATGVVAWLRNFGFGKVSLAVGLAAAAAIWLLATQSGLQSQRQEAADGVHLAAAPAGDLVPGVIIEEMDIESGTVLVSPEAAEGGATVIWHFDDQGGAG